MVLAIVRQDARRIMGRWSFLASVFLAAGMVLYALFANCISVTLGQSALAAQPSLLFASPPSDLNGAFLPPDVLCATGMCQLGYAWLLLPMLCGSVIGDDFKNGYVLVRRVHGASDRCVRIGQTIAALLSATLYFMLTAAIVFLCCAGVSVARGMLATTATSTMLCRDRKVHRSTEIVFCMCAISRLLGLPHWESPRSRSRCPGSFDCAPSG